MLPLPTGSPVKILGVGSILLHKRWDRVITAVRVLKGRGFQFTIDIAGDGPLRELLENQSRRLGTADYIRFLGHSDDIPTLLASSTLLVHTSDVEGCPNAILEAMACGRAVVATDVGDISSLVEDGKTGFVVNRADDALLVERMARLIADQSLRQRMGQAAWAKARREFGLDRLVEETLGAYRAAGWRDS